MAQELSLYGDTASAAEFAQLLDVAKQVQPKDAHEAGKPIDVRAFYCAYRALPARLQARVSAGQILAMVQDPPARKRAFAQQAVDTSGSLGADVCDWVVPQGKRVRHPKGHEGVQPFLKPPIRWLDPAVDGHGSNAFESHLSGG